MKLVNFKKLRNMFKMLFPIILPIFMGLFYALFYYSSNLVYASLESLLYLLIIFVSVSILSYFIAFIIFKKDPIKAALSSTIFIFLFNIYGIVYSYLLNLDFFRIEHFTLLPLFLFITYVSVQNFLKIPKEFHFNIWKILCLILGSLIVYNLILIVPYEVRNAYTQREQSKTAINKETDAELDYPDIYYLLFDEFSGFGPIRDYWGYEKISEFEDYLMDENFHTFHNSKGLTINTLHEVATRLNFLEDLPCNPYDPDCYLISNSNLYVYLKEKGYTFIEFNQIREVFPDVQHFQSDYIFEQSSVSTSQFSKFFDEFIIMALDQTMLSAFPNAYKTTITDERLRNHKNMIDFTVDNIGNFEEISTPRFIYVHLLIPHNPFMFDEFGNILDQQHEFDWNYYLGNYIYSLTIIEEMITNIRDRSNLENQPVIILQSDHGARNHVMGTNQNTLLKDFPEEFKFSILFSIQAPDCSFDEFPNDLKPVNTFPIVFNCIFNDNIPLIE